MHNAPVPPASELPTPRALLRSTLTALAVASVLLVTVVLPAEYGIDPTGIGGPLGLTRMGEIKMALAREAEADAAAHAAAAAIAETSAAATSEASGATALEASSGGGNVEQIDILLEPGQSRSYQLSMKRGGSVSYEWFTDWGVVSFELSGEPASASSGTRRAYAEGAGRASDDGTLVAAFDGLHGWVWRNAGQEAVTVTLRVQGEYQELREIK